ncbi:MAG TPA: response regulator transcription factor [Cyclobacteriaceae bacterium]|nr:response regulator transcription factor [Cyclobacteriaceae bacterium]
MKTTADKIRVMIVDDHRLFNDGLCGMLNSEEGFSVVAQVYDSREAAQLVMKHRPDVVLVDFNMPHLNGIELTDVLTQQMKEVKVLILSMYTEEIYVDRFRRSRSKGYLFKTAALDEVLTAIRTVHDGGTYFPTSAKKNVHQDDLFLKKLRLSGRELEVIQLVKEGLTTKEIASKLNISFYTAETHRKNIKVKIGIEGEAAFVKFVHSNDWKG